MEITFKDLLLQNETEIKSYMKWENYDLNDVVIPVVETLKDHALMVLRKSYGKYTVCNDILDELCNDIFIYFPILMQQLAISRLMDAYGVVQDDVVTDTLTRTENIKSDVEQNSELRLGTSVNETSSINNQQKSTGTVDVENDNLHTQKSDTAIENTSDVNSTGNRTVNLSHNMPEQAISGSTGDFITDPEGTPILTGSYVNGANESFNTTNPIGARETSNQNVTSTTTNSANTKTTNDLTVSDTGSNTREVTNSGVDNSDSITSTEGTNTVEETRTRTETNKQYAYEIKAFLESIDTLIAFRNWEDRFSWVVGII